MTHRFSSTVNVAQREAPDLGPCQTALYLEDVDLNLPPEVLKGSSGENPVVGGLLFVSNGELYFQSHKRERRVLTKISFENEAALDLSLQLPSKDLYEKLSKEYVNIDTPAGVPQEESPVLVETSPVVSTSPVLVTSEKSPPQANPEDSKNTSPVEVLSAAGSPKSRQPRKSEEGRCLRFGEDAGALNEGEDNLFFGHHTVSKSRFVGRRSVFIGNFAGEKLEDSDGLVLIGDSAGKSLTEGIDHIFIGRLAGARCEKGNSSIAIGPETLGNSSDIGHNIAIGPLAMSLCGKIEYNIAIGPEALQSICDNYNIGIGFGAGRGLKGPLANHNIIIGKEGLANAEPTCIDIIALGNMAGNNLKGSNFQNILIGKKAGQFLHSTVISDNNILIGTDSGREGFNLTEVICLGHLSGKKIKGGRAVVIGAKAAEVTEGELSDDVLIGYRAGTSRVYAQSSTEKSQHVFIGFEAGSGNLGDKSPSKRLIALGVQAGSSATGEDSIFLGKNAGSNSKQIGSLLFGVGAGKDSEGAENIYLGRNVGFHRKGDHNIWLGSTSAQHDEVLADNVILGFNINRIRGKESVVIGCEAGSTSLGFLNRDILIGFQAGVGQQFATSAQESANWICIGAHAGQAANTNNSKGTVICFGHNAGRSEEQSFSNSLFFGHGAGSFGGNISDSIYLGINTGLGSEGDHNLYFGNGNGSSVKGSGNIFIGSHIGENVKEETSNLFLLGNHQHLFLSGDMERGNLALAKNKEVDFGGGEGCLYLEETKSVPTLTKSEGVLLNSRNNQLYLTSRINTSLVSLPYRYHFQTVCKQSRTLLFDVSLHETNNFLLSIQTIDGYRAVYNVNRDVVTIVSSNEMATGGGYTISYEEYVLKFFANKERKSLATPIRQQVIRATPTRKSSVSSELVAGLVEIIPSSLHEKINIRFPF